MRVVGFILLVVGALVALFSFSMETTVHSEASYVAGQFVSGGDTYNLGLLQRQLMVFQLGIGMLIAGAALAAGSWSSAFASGENDRFTATAPDETATTARSATLSTSGLPLIQETDEEREQRLAQERRADVIGYWAMGIAVCVGVLFIVIAETYR